MASETGAATQHITTNDGVRLAYERAGAAGPVVVLIHGWSGSRKYFCRNIAALAEHCQVSKLLVKLMSCQAEESMLHARCLQGYTCRLPFISHHTSSCMPGRDIV
jgi:hypothetical protein